MRLIQDLAVVDAKTDIRIGRSSTEFPAFDAPGRMYFDLQKADSRVQRSARKELFEIESKYIRLVHHRPEDAVDGIADETRQARNLQEAHTSVP